MGKLLDIVIAILAVAGAGTGFWRGLGREVSRIVVAITAIGGGLLLRGVGQWVLLNGFGTSYFLSTILAFPFAALVVFGLALVVAWVVEKEFGLDKPTFGLRYLGAIFGAARGTIAGLIIAVILSAYPLPGDPFAKARSVGLVRALGISQTPAMIGPLGRNASALAKVSGDPARVQQLIESPEIRAIATSETVQAVVRDPEIVALVERKDIAGLLSNPKIDAMIRDPAFRAQIEALNLEEIAGRISPAGGASPGTPNAR